MEQTLLNSLSDGTAEELGIELHAIGDMVWPREPYDVVYEASMLARAL